MCFVDLVNTFNRAEFMAAGMNAASHLGLSLWFDKEKSVKIVDVCGEYAILHRKYGQFSPKCLQEMLSLAKSSSSKAVRLINILKALGFIVPFDDSIKIENDGITFICEDRDEIIKLCYRK